MRLGQGGLGACASTFLGNALPLFFYNDLQKKIGFKDFFINLKLHFKVTIYCKSKSFFGLAKSVSEDTGSLIHIHKSCVSKHKQQSF